MLASSASRESLPGRCAVAPRRAVPYALRLLVPRAAGLTSFGVRRATELVNLCPLDALAAVVSPLRCFALSV